MEQPRRRHALITPSLLPSLLLSLINETHSPPSNKIFVKNLLHSGNHTSIVRDLRHTCRSYQRRNAFHDPPFPHRKPARPVASRQRPAVRGCNAWRRQAVHHQLTADSPGRSATPISRGTRTPSGRKTRGFFVSGVRGGCICIDLLLPISNEDEHSSPWGIRVALARARSRGAAATGARALRGDAPTRAAHGKRNNALSAQALQRIADVIVRNPDRSGTLHSSAGSLPAWCARHCRGVCRGVETAVRRRKPNG